MTTQDSKKNSADERHAVPHSEDNFLRLSILGAEEAGKTSFLAGLACLGGRVQSSPFSIYPEDAEAGQYLRQLKNEFRNGIWPTRTSITTLVHFTFKYTPLAKKNKKQKGKGKDNAGVIPGDFEFDKSGKYTVRLATVDYPGQDFCEAFNSMSPERIERFREHLLLSDILLLLVDVDDLVGPVEKTERVADRLCAQLAAVREIVKGNSSVKSRRKQSARSPVSLCIGITKADRVPDLLASLNDTDGGSEYARNYVLEKFPAFENKILEETGVAGIRYFPISAVGKTVVDKNGIAQPDRKSLSPVGYGRLFNWIAAHPKRSSENASGGHSFLLAVSILLFLVAAFVGFQYASTHYSLNIFGNKHLTSVEKLDKTKGHVLSSQGQEERNKIFKDELTRLRLAISETSELSSLQKYLADLQNLTTKNPGQWKTDIEHLQTDAHNRIVLLEFEKVQKAYEKKSDDFLSLVAAFQKNYPDALKGKEIERMVDSFELGEMAKARFAIASILLDNRESLKKKVAETFAFLNKYESHLSEEEKLEMRRASLLAQKFASRKEYKATLLKYGGFNYNENQQLVILVGGRKVFKDDRSLQKSKENNVAIDFSFQWEFNEAIEVQLLADENYIRSAHFVTAAERTISGPDVLRFLDGRLSLFGTNNGNYDWSLSKYQGAGGYFAEIRFDDIAKEDWDAFAKYIYPGDQWTTTREEPHE